MLGKLFSYEMKACSRLLLPLYLVLAAITILERIVIGLNIFNGTLVVIPAITTIAFIVAIITIAVVSVVIIIVRFYKNLVTDEGYLMFTLPVKSHQLIISKLIAGIIWIIGSISAILAALFLAFGTLVKSDSIFEFLREVSLQIKQELGDDCTLFFIEIFALIIISLVSNILHIYASIAIGQLFSGHKILGSVVAYIITQTLMQIIVIVFLVGTNIISGLDFNNINILTLVIWPVLILITILFSAGYYCITNYIFKNKLNLE